jgi:2',3'-cyclic-nucleotide 2'-phosphodiesterase (5'-nucleotidase family)
MSTNLPLLAFNDVYRVSQRYVPQPGCDAAADTPADAEIGVGQFGKLIDTLRQKWAARADGTMDGLVLFAGDVFSPSVESSVTRGSHMVPILNALRLDAACIGESPHRRP